MGNRDELTKVFEKERRRLVGYAQRGTGNEAESEDLVQDVFTRILSSTLNPIENLTAYIYRALEYRMIDFFRKKPEQNLSFEEIEDTLGSHALDRILEDFRTNTSEKLEKQELSEILERELEKLPAPQKAVLIANEVEGLTFETLSEQWNESVGTLLSRKHRAVQTLRKRLSKFI